MQTNYDKLKTLLRELFQMDQADLDFGLYRIMNAKRGEIERFLEHDLLPQVKSELARHITLDSGAKQAELAAAIEGAQKLGMNPDAVPKVQELRTQLKQGGDLDVLENEVFSHLYNFFRRYYHQGDFLSLRRYKEGVYAIPYEGEEVKLHWANHDQYYIKSTEYLRNYTFKLRDSRRVHLKVVEADTEADNNKPQGGKERRFILAEAAPVAVEKGELFLRFHYQADARKQTELNAAAVAAVLGNPALMDWLAELGDLRPTDKRPDRTLLAKHLDDFTARHAFDYFIHKDLGGFLRRELDFFIKNEIMHLDDVEDEAAPKVELYLSKIKALRKIAHKFIAFLEQLENFQKRLWLKKKFVVETNYCVTLDRVPEALYPEIAANDAQRAEWVKLFAIDEIKASASAPAPAQGELIATSAPGPTPGYSVPLTVEFLEANPFLVLDTKFFSAAFTVKLLADSKALGGAPTLDTATGGLLVNGENFQALGLLLARFREEVKCIYIDPPYNTGNDGFAYKDNYQHSSWLSLMNDRLGVARALLQPEGGVFCSIDDKELHALKYLFYQVFGEASFLAQIEWQKRYTRSNNTDNFTTVVEHILGFAKTAGFQVNLLRRTEEANARFTNPDNDPRGPWKATPFLNQVAPDKRPSLCYPITNPKTGSVTNPTKKAWRLEKSEFERLQREDRLWWGKEGTTNVPDIKTFLSEVRQGMTPINFWDHEYAGNTDQANQEIKDLFGTKVFDTPKPSQLVRRVSDHAMQADEPQWLLDFFGGSGTSGHAVVSQNREDGGGRKFILVEMGNHFDAVLKPRIQKVIYSKDWKDGKPLSREGSSHLFKYIRLESYEDCLNNLELKRTPAQDDLLAEAKDFREDYTLRYMLDVETRGSASLLNVQQFTDPFNYQLQVSTGTVGETKAVKVDLVETFNWLVGLTVKHMDHIRNVRVVEGTNPAGDRVLILWRTVAEVPNDKLDEWFKAQGYNTRDQEYDLIYVNGDNHLENFRRADQTWKVRPIEEDFHRLMWECQDV